MIKGQSKVSLRVRISAGLFPTCGLKRHCFTALRRIAPIQAGRNDPDISPYLTPMRTSVQLNLNSSLPGIARIFRLDPADQVALSLGRRYCHGFIISLLCRRRWLCFLWLPVSRL